ncbi:MAG: hypothetical protein RLZZ200_177 [Pseudomonadota bacterium]|jgi:DNA-binding MarR family transcriptional regulator
MPHAPEEQIGYLLKRVMHVFRHLLEERLRRSAEISFGHLVTLDQIKCSPGIAGAELARNLLVTAQTMTDLLKRLEREGSIERRSDPRNRRRDHWFLLPEGEARLASARRAGAPVMTQMLSLLSADEVVQFRRFLERCVEGLEQSVSGEALLPSRPPVQRAVPPKGRNAKTARAAPVRGKVPRKRTGAH